RRRRARARSRYASAHWRSQSGSTRSYPRDSSAKLRLAQPTELLGVRPDTAVTVDSFEDAPPRGEIQYLVECRVDGLRDRRRPEKPAYLLHLLSVDDHRGLVRFRYLSRHRLDILAAASA